MVNRVPGFLIRTTSGGYEVQSEKGSPLHELDNNFRSISRDIPDDTVDSPEDIFDTYFTPHFKKYRRDPVRYGNATELLGQARPFLEDVLRDMDATLSDVELLLTTGDGRGLAARLATDKGNIAMEAYRPGAQSRYFKSEIGMLSLDHAIERSEDFGLLQHNKHRRGWLKFWNYGKSENWQRPIDVVIYTAEN